MKTLFTHLALVLFFIMSTHEKMQAQIITAYINDSLETCPNPGNDHFYTNTLLNGFTVGDVINQTLYFGDGTSHTFPPFVVSNVYQYTNNPSIMHTYLTAGIFNAYFEVTGPGVPTYTTPVNPVGIAGLTCGTASGTVYNDLNNNCIINPGEAMGNQVVTVVLAGNILGTDYTDGNGNYNIDFPYAPGNTYIVKKGFSYNMPCFGVLCPNTINYAVTNQFNANLNFGVGPLNNNMYDLNTHITMGGGQYNAGTSKDYKLYYGNMGCVSANAIFTITMDPSMVFTSSVPAPTSIAGNVLTYNLNNLTPQYFYNQYVVLTSFLPLLNNANVPFAIGDSVSLSCTIAGVGGTEFDPTDNTRNRWFAIGTSYDPNDKHVSPRGQGPAGNVGFGTEFTYDIHFQNTGNAPAMNVVITDTLDADIDENTIEIIGKTHHMIYSIVGNALKFEFPNIMLPDSLSDPQGSQGGLSFKAKHKTGLANNTAITNKAYIYFDANPAIITNTTLNTLMSPTSTNDLAQEMNIMISPNPVSGILNIHSADKNIEQIEIQNILGETVARHTVNDYHFSINMSSYTTGVYFIKLRDAKGNIYTRKISKQ